MKLSMEAASTTPSGKSLSNPVSSISSQKICTQLLAVIVVYERDLNSVLVWPFLRHSLDTAPDNSSTTQSSGFSLNNVLIYDNSPHARATPTEQLSGCLYVHDAGNGGTAAAYTHAIQLATTRGIEWLLLLDQDTTLPCGFIDAASTALLKGMRKPSALVPWVFQGDHPVSPARVTAAGSFIPLQYDALSHEMSNLTAISSGCLLYVPDLLQMPIPKGLWLDYVDHWIFGQFRKRRLLVRVFDSSLQHNLSLFSLKSLTLSRLTSILNGEMIFLSTLGIKARLVFPFRLAARVMHYAWHRPQLATHTLGWIVYRILLRRR